MNELIVYDPKGSSRWKLWWWKLWKSVVSLPNWLCQLGMVLALTSSFFIILDLQEKIEALSVGTQVQAAEVSSKPTSETKTGSEDGLSWGYEAVIASVGFGCLALITSILIGGRRKPPTVTRKEDTSEAPAPTKGAGKQEQKNGWWKSFSNLKLPRIPSWVFVVVVIGVGLAYFWPTTDTSTVSTATEMIQKGIEKGSEAASSTTKAAAESNFFVWMMEHPVVAVVVAILIFWIASALFDLRNVESTGLLGRVFYVVLSCIAISLTFIALRMFILYGPEGAIKRTQTYWEKNVESVERSDNSEHSTLEFQKNSARVISEYITIPANGTVTVPIQKRCYADSFTDEEGRKVTRTETPAGLVYRSNSSSELTRKVWFFDEGGDCVQDYDKLLPTQAFK